MIPFDKTLPIVKSCIEFVNDVKPRASFIMSKKAEENFCNYHLQCFTSNFGQKDYNKFVQYMLSKEQNIENMVWLILYQQY
jgi:hypothetical protein